MSLGSMLMVPAQQGTLLGVGGDWEIPHSRRRIDLIEAFYLRSAYEGLTGSAGVRIDYSLDGGGNWSVLVPTGPYFVANTMIATDWTEMADEPHFAGDMLVRAVAQAAVGLTVTIYWVELQWR